MARACTVCAHPERAAIDRALVGGEPNRRVAARHAVSEQAIRRHRSDHLPAALADAAATEKADAGTDLLREVKALRGKAYSLLLKAEAAGDYRTALAGVREARACLELLGEVEGELDRRQTVNILVAPEWLAARAALMLALRPYPDAAVAVAASLAAIEERA